MKRTMMQHAACGAVLFGLVFAGEAAAQVEAFTPPPAPIMYRPTSNNLRIPAPADYRLEQFSLKAVQVFCHSLENAATCHARRTASA